MCFSSLSIFYMKEHLQIHSYCACVNIWFIKQSEIHILSLLFYMIDEKPQGDIIYQCNSQYLKTRKCTSTLQL